MIGAGLIRSVASAAAAIKADVLALFAAGDGSGLLGFLQSGVGAVARTLQAKVRERISVKDFGAVGDGVTDDAAAIQAAIDYAQTLLPLNTWGAPEVFFPSGDYLIGSTLVWKSAALIGEGSPNSGVRLTWGGAAGGTLMQKWADSHGGNKSFGYMECLNLRGSGANKPAILLDLSTSVTTVDVMFQLRRVHLSVASDVLVNVGYWTNLHWSDMRFDGGDNYAIRAEQIVGGSGASFCIDRFTYDNGGTGKGFLRLDTSAAGVNVGVVSLKDARVELNGAWSGEKAFISHAPGAAVRTAHFSLENIAFADGGTVGNFVLYRDSATNGSEVLHCRNIIFNSAAAWTTVGGALTANLQAVPPTRNYAELLATVSAQSAGAIFSDLGWCAPASSTVYPAYMRQTGDTKERWRMRSDGRMEWGPGGAADTDTVLERSTADTLRLATGDKFIPQTTGQQLGAAGNQWRVFNQVVAAADLPAGGPTMNGVILIEDGGGGNRNLVFYTNDGRYRVAGGAVF